MTIKRYSVTFVDAPSQPSFIVLATDVDDAFEQACDWAIDKMLLPVEWAERDENVFGKVQFNRLPR